MGRRKPVHEGQASFWDSTSYEDLEIRDATQKTPLVGIGNMLGGQAISRSILNTTHVSAYNLLEEQHQVYAELFDGLLRQRAESYIPSSFTVIEYGLTPQNATECNALFTRWFMPLQKPATKRSPHHNLLPEEFYQRDPYQEEKALTAKEKFAMADRDKYKPVKTERLAGQWSHVTRKRFYFEGYDRLERYGYSSNNHFMGIARVEPQDTRDAFYIFEIYKPERKIDKGLAMVFAPSLQRFLTAEVIPISRQSYRSGRKVYQDPGGGALLLFSRWQEKIEKATRGFGGYHPSVPPRKYNEHFRLPIFQTNKVLHPDDRGPGHIIPY